MQTCPLTNALFDALLLPTSGSSPDDRAPVAPFLEEIYFRGILRGNNVALDLVNKHGKIVAETAGGKRTDGWVCLSAGRHS